MVRHHGAEDNTLGPDDCKAYGLGPVANTDTKLLIYGLFQKGRVLAQDEELHVVRHHGAEDNTLGPDDCKAHGPSLGSQAQTLSC